MYLKEYLEKFNGEKIKLFVDMDGVIADYDVGKPYEYDLKRPLFSSIEKLKEIERMDNVELYILSISRMNEGVEQKNVWLDRYVSFIKKENRFIIPREANNFEEPQILKTDFITKLNRDGSIIILIDDDPAILKKIHETNNDILLLKDTALVD